MEVLSTDRATDALEVVEQSKPSLVLLDAVLPNGYRVELVERG